MVQTIRIAQEKFHLSVEFLDSVQLKLSEAGSLIRRCLVLPCRSMRVQHGSSSEGSPQKQYCN